MMLIICDKNPKQNVKYLVEHTNKNFVFKSLIELGQLICSCGYSNRYKKISQGKELQDWITRNPQWTYEYMKHLFVWCQENVNLSNKTYNDLKSIITEIGKVAKYKGLKTTPKEVIFRYKNTYKSDIPSKMLLNIDTAINKYRHYIEWKFNKVDNKFGEHNV